MRARDTSDVLASAAAVGFDAAAIFGGFLLATWIRFDSGWIPLFHDRPPPRLYFMYGWGAAIAALLFLFLFRALGLYIRPQIGRFESKIPRLARAVGLGILFAGTLGFALRTDPPFSRLVLALSAATVLVFVLVERYLLFRAELHMARHGGQTNRVLVVGTNPVAARLARAFRHEPRLRSRVIGFLATAAGAPDESIPAEAILGRESDLEALLKREPVDQLVMADTNVPQSRMVEIILLCERNLVTFNVVPDLFRILTGGVDMQTVDDIPLLGVSRWPLDYFWNRALKRAEDVIGALAGLVIFAPAMLVAAALIRRESPGPAFFRQVRCGEKGREFTLYKLRTMNADAEVSTGPVWTTENDPRRTRVGAFLRRHNLDELPQFWNVLRGDMSLVGPRPERPYFVNQFREDIGGYMWRHQCKPGMTGWAQVNGMRGNTSIQERVKYDLYYLEKWSLAFDFKILVKTVFARDNAY